MSDRYERIRDILPMEPLQRALAIVGGTGALGNEVLKNLALLGVGNVLVCDFDRVEIHNLTRSILFRQEDTGRFKAEVAAARMKQINPEINVIPFTDSIAELGAGFFRRADMIFSTFDAYFPRYVLNEICLRYRKVWVDGGMSALEHTRGGVAVYDCSDKNEFCYSCATSPQLVRNRLGAMIANVGCTVYENVTGEVNGVPSTPMMASVVGGIQTSAALEMFYSRISPNFSCLWPFGSWELDISNLSHRRVKRKKMAGCYHHETVEAIDHKIIECPEWNSTRTTYRDVLERAQVDMATDRISIHLPEDFYTIGYCSACEKPWELFRLKSTFKTRGKYLTCPSCDEKAFNIAGSNICAEVDFDWEYLDRPLCKVGCRPLDVLTVVKYDQVGVPETSRHYEITGDAERFGLVGRVEDRIENGEQNDRTKEKA